MAAIDEILDAQKGPYEWGLRDCLTTAAAICKAFNRGRSPSVDWWHSMSEWRAIVSAVHAYGSLRQAHARHFESVKGIERLDPRVESVRPGDIVSLGGAVDLADGSRWETKGERHLLAFVRSDCAIMQWSKRALSRVISEPEITDIYRCGRHGD